MATNENLFHVGDQDFENKVLRSDKPVIVDFWAAWCGPCRSIAPTYERLSTEYQGKLGFAKMDIDENPEVPGQLGIQAIPTMMIFQSGKVIGRIVGALPPARLKAEIDRVLTQSTTAN